MNKILNPKALSEIQAQRKLEQSGDLKEQMAQLLAIVESSQVANVIEMTTIKEVLASLGAEIIE